jgi:hypothetical protein
MPRHMNAGTPQTNVQDREPSQVQAARGRAIGALAHVEHGHRDAMDELRVALCEYVGALRREGASRETTLANVRSLVSSPATPDGALALTPIVREALAELTLQWCEAEYNRLASEVPGSGSA